MLLPFVASAVGEVGTGEPGIVGRDRGNSSRSFAVVDDLLDFKSNVC